MQQTPNNNLGGQEFIATKNLDEQTLVALQQLGLFPQLLQNTSNNNNNSNHIEGLTQNNEIFLNELKAQLRLQETANQQQCNKASKEIFRRRPSLMHDSGSTLSSRYSHSGLPSDSSQSVLHPSHSTDITPISTTNQDPQGEDDGKQKQLLSERLNRIEQERSQSTKLQRNAQKKAKACEILLRQGPMMVTEDGREDAEDSEGEVEEQSPADALIERIYAENKRKQTRNAGGAFDPSAATNQFGPGTIESNLLNNLAQEQLGTEDEHLLAEEYERSVQLLPALVQAMRIQRERRQDAMESRRIMYEEQLASWERKVAAYEKSQRKLVKDVKCRELFEKTFIELRKMREEKERNIRGERSRYSLAQGGNGIPSTSEPFMAFVNSEQIDNEQPIENDAENIDEKAYAAAIVPPTYVTRPRRFFDNRNGIMDNPTAEASAQIELFQNQWAEFEKDVFMEKIAIYGKNFAAISAFLPSKNVKECIQYYYMTKKRNNYKQKFGRRRKKIGRQGYRPPVMPQFGDTAENVQLQNYGRDCTFVECLLCGTRILVLESLTQQQQHPFDSFGSLSSTLSRQHQIPICTKCQGQAQRNRTLNRCPLGSCTCVVGKRKMRPVRNVPEKFATLSIEHKRFLIHRLKMPPSTNKCCTNCFKRIAKDIDGLLVGEYNSELETFNKIAPIQAESRSKPTHLDEEEEEEEEEASKNANLGEEFWMGTEGPPPKEMKLELKEEEWEEEMMRMDQVPATRPAEASLVSSVFRFQSGSITKGIPNRNRSTLLGNLEQHSAEQVIKTEKEDPLLANVVTTHAGEQLGVVGSFEDFASNVLAQFNVLCSNESRTTNPSLTLAGMATPLSAVGSSKVHKAIAPGKEAQLQNPTKGKKAAESKQDLRRKSGLANALLPSPAVEGNSNVNRISNQPAKEEAQAEQGATRQLAVAESEEGPMSSSCYESLSEDSDNEKSRAKEGVEEQAPKKSSSGAAVAPFNFLSLLDLMDEHGDTAGADTPGGQGEAQRFGAPVMTNSASSQRDPTTSVPMPKCNSDKTPKRDGQGAREGTREECVYEPLSEDEA